MLEDGGCITCVDTWKGGEEHIVVAEDMGSVEERFEWNMREVNSCYPLREIRKAKGTSYEFLASFIASKEQFDFVYIDGSHIAKDVLTDACMVWPLVKVGGIVVFDDYLWGEPRDVLHRPKLAVDTFVNLFAEEVHMMHLGYQFIVKRVA
jgi:predicted O-methyltransferase YrrM